MVLLASSLAPTLPPFRFRRPVRLNAKMLYGLPTALMRKGAVVVMLGVFHLVFTAGLAYYSLEYYRHDVARDSGLEAEAVVVSKEGSRGSNPPALRLWYVTADTNTVASRTFVGKATWAAITVGDTVAVRYHPERPEVVVLPEGDNTNGVIGLGMFGFCCALALNFVFAMVYMHK